jgi:hypothetical protein
MTGFASLISASSHTLHATAAPVLPLELLPLLRPPSRSLKVPHPCDHNSPKLCPNASVLLTARMTFVELPGREQPRYNLADDLCEEHDTRAKWHCEVHKQVDEQAASISSSHLDHFIPSFIM